MVMRRHILDRYLRAQPIHRQALGEVGNAFALDIQQKFLTQPSP